MVEYILNETYLKDNILNLVSAEACDNIVIFNKSCKFEQPVTEGTVNILNFLEQNEICIQDECIFSLAVKQEQGLAIMTLPAATANSCIYKGAEIKTNKYTYIFNILTTENNELLLHSKRQTKNNVDINIKDLHINNSIFSMTIEKVGARFIDEIGIVLTNSLGEVRGITCSTSKGNEATFNLDLQDLAKNGRTTYAANLILDGQILPLHFDRDFTLTKQAFRSETGLNIVTAELNEFNNLSIDVTNEILINPILLETKCVDNTFSILGKLNSNINYSIFEEYKTMIKFTSNSGTKSVVDEVTIEKGKFEYSLSYKELFELKDTDYKKWNISLIVQKGDIEITSKNINCNNVIDNMSTNISYDGASATLNLTLDDQGNLEILVNGALTIEQILSIQKRGKKLVVKYRTVENIEKLIQGKKLKTNIVVEDKVLNCKKIVSRGKKTYTCTYYDKDINKIIDTIVEKGLTVVSTIQNTRVSQNIPEINEMTIYRNITEALQNTKKYKKFTSDVYKKVFLKLPVNENKVMLESFLGRNVSGQPKYIYDYMVKKGMDYNYKFIWILNDLDEEIPGKHKKVKRKSLKYYYHMATSGKWIFNARQADEIIKRPETTYLQTWHGTCLKKLAGDMSSVDMGGNTDIEEYRNRFFKNTSRWDYLLAQNDYSKEIFARAFNFKKDIILGYPANDILYNKNNPSYINKLKEKLNIPKDKKVILYAPTWRDDAFYKKGHYKLNLELELDKMQKELGKDYVVIIKAHYLIANSINLSDYKGFAYDFSKGYDIQELYLISDILITDYSSTMFDYANLKRPMIFFTYDLEKYRDNLRGFYFDFEATAPGPIVKTTEGVINSIKNIDSVTTEYKELSEAFYNKFCHVDNGNSAEKVVNILFKK